MEEIIQEHLINGNVVQQHFLVGNEQVLSSDGPLKGYSSPEQDQQERIESHSRQPQQRHANDEVEV